MRAAAAITVAACNPDKSRGAFKSYNPILVGGEGDPAEFEAHVTECRYDGLMLAEAPLALITKYDARVYLDRCLAARGYKVADDWKDNPSFTVETPSP